MQISDITTRQKMVIGVFVLVLIVLVWQVMGLFHKQPPTFTNATATPAAQTTPQQPVPKQASLPKPVAISEQDVEALLKMQAAGQSKDI